MASSSAISVIRAAQGLLLCFSLLHLLRCFSCLLMLFLSHPSSSLISFIISQSSVQQHIVLKNCHLNYFMFNFNAFSITCFSMLAHLDMLRSILCFVVLQIKKLNFMECDSNTTHWMPMKLPFRTPESAPPRAVCTTDKIMNKNYRLLAGFSELNIQRSTDGVNTQMGWIHRKTNNCKQLKCTTLEKCVYVYNTPSWQSDLYNSNRVLEFKIFEKFCNLVCHNAQRLNTNKAKEKVFKFRTIDGVECAVAWSSINSKFAHTKKNAESTFANIDVIITLFTLHLH